MASKPIFDADTAVNVSWTDFENAAKAFWDSEEWLSATTYYLDAATGVFTETGNASGMNVARVENTASGAFVETGNNSQMLRSRVANTASGAFAETGSAAGIQIRRMVATGTGVFLLTGTNVAMFTFTVLPSRKAIINFQNPAEHQIGSNLLGSLTTVGLKAQEGQSSWPR